MKRSILLIAVCLVCVFSSGLVLGGEADLSGRWWYTEMLFTGGKTQALRNRESSLEFSGNKFTQSMDGGGRDGTYTVSGNRLTLNVSAGEKEVYTMTLSANSLTLISSDGSGWKLERR
jgi:hypothetical protein